MIHGSAPRFNQRIDCTKAIAGTLYSVPEFFYSSLAVRTNL
jgi:hypothetical protein